MLFEIRYKSLCFAKKVLDKENIVDHHLYSFFAATISAGKRQGFPTGKYTTRTFRTGIYEIVFRDDGGYGYPISGHVLMEATDAVDVNEISFLSDGSDYEDMDANPATYQWQYKDGTLTFEVVGQDLCAQRFYQLSMDRKDSK